MPGVEVYTISGLGAPKDVPGTLDYHIAHPASSSGPASPVVRLQNALRALGTTAGDPQLTSVSIDGVVGPATVKATNYALANFVGATPGFPKANLTAIQVRQSAAVLADRIEARTKASGGTVPPPPAVTAKSRAVSHAPAFVPEAPPEPDRRWVFWVVGGVGTIVLLSAVTIALKKRRGATA